MALRRLLVGIAALLFTLTTATAQAPESRWEADIQAFEALDRTQPPPENPIVFIGSSSIRMWNIEQSFPSLPTVNRGFGGSTIPDATAFIDRIVVPYEPEIIVFYSGDNDVAGGATADRVVADFKIFVEAVHTQLPDTPIVVLSIKPSGSRWNLWPVMDEANKRIAVYAGDHPLLTYVDVATPLLDQYGRPDHSLFLNDQLHLNEAGYAVWNSTLKPVLLDLLESADINAVTVEPGGGAVEFLAKTPVEQGHTYAIAWDMNIAGDKPWRFRADFAGVEYTFYNAAGKRLGTSRQHTHCWETLGWRPAWVIVTAPSNAAQVAARMAIESTEPLPGQFQVRNASVVDLSTRAPSEGKGLLHIVVTDGEGNATPARIYVRDDSGNGHTPRFVFTTELGGPAFYFQDLDVNAIELPPGNYSVRALKGFEYEPAETQVEVRAGEIHQADLTLTRINDLDGWVSGDHHVHLFRHGASLYPMIDLDDIYTIAKAEGLEYLPFMGADKVAESKLDHREPGFLAMVNEEMTRDLWGHICPIGVREWPRMLEYGEVWPMNYYWIAAAEKAGGSMAYAHPYGPIIPGFEMHFVNDPVMGGHIAREFPIDIALGLHCTFDLLAKEDKGGDFALKQRDVMRLYNLGFRFGLTGSTDFHVDQARQPIGGIRTYAKAGLDWDSIAVAYREGRTFATNGPLVQFSVDGKGIGDTVRLAGPGEVACTVHAESLWGLDAVEIWHNGVSVQEVPALEGRVDESVNVPIETSGWLLAIARGPAEPEVMHAPEDKPMVDGQYAITSPVYIDVPGRPAPVNPDEVDYFVGWCDTVAEAVQKEIEAFEEDGGRVPDDVRKNIGAKILAARSAFARLGGTTDSKMERLKSLEPTHRLLTPSLDR